MKVSAKQFKMESYLWKMKTLHYYLVLEMCAINCITLLQVNVCSNCSTSKSVWENGKWKPVRIYHLLTAANGLTQWEPEGQVCLWLTDSEYFWQCWLNFFDVYVVIHVFYLSGLQ